MISNHIYIILIILITKCFFLSQNLLFNFSAPVPEFDSSRQLDGDLKLLPFFYTMDGDVRSNILLILFPYNYVNFCRF